MAAAATTPALGQAHAQVRTRILNVVQLLGAIPCPTRRAQTAKCQSVAIVQMLNTARRSLNADAVADLQAMVVQSASLWQGHDAILMSSLQQSTEDVKSVVKSVRKRALQAADMTRMLLPEEWEALAAPGALTQSILINRMVQVGIQCPKEPTLKLACSIAVYFSMGTDRESLKAEDFKRRLHCFKAEFKRQAEREAPTMSGLE